MNQKRFVLGWQLESETLPLLDRIKSKKLDSVARSPHGMWNYMTYRDAINILGMDPSRIYTDGRIDLDPEKWADFGWMLCHCGPPQSAVREMREQTSSSNINPYSPDLITPLRDLCAEHVFKRRRDGNFEVIGTEGAQAGISYVLNSFTDPGDEIIITDPGYFHFESAILMAGGVPVKTTLDSDNKFRLDPLEIEKLLSEKTKIIIVCDPINPFGTVQKKQELVSLIEIARDNDIIIMNDITHNTHRIDPHSEHFPMSSLWKDTNTDNVISIYSVSHGYGMAAVRIGFLAGHPDIMKACLRTKVSITRLNTNLIAQYGALAALGDTDYIARTEKIIRRNYHFIKNVVSRTPGIKIPVEPSYGFSMVIDVSGTGVTAQELTVSLFKRNIAVYPGDGLGDSGATDYVRLNFSHSDQRALKRFEDSLGEAIKEARTGIYTESVISFFEQKPNKRAEWILRKLKDRVRDR
ncbi:MAG: pyridoxal phosphate-dependent aminotransferase [Candidatus Dadabacteria bacterium]|nr:pyridoxal phosphate-dependent aminotransferase [Candidatus Dadabacteria bacterium]